MPLDIDGFKEKVLRRTGSQTTVEAYLKGVKKLGQFAEERLGTDLQGLVDRLESKQLDTYETLDRFAGWAVARKDRDGNPIMPRTVHRYMEGTKKFLRYHSIEILNDRFRDRVTMPVAEEIPDVALEREDIRRILLSSMPLWARAMTSVMKDAGTRIGETSKVRWEDIFLDEEPARIHLRKEVTKATRSGGRMARDVFITSESVELLKQLQATPYDDNGRRSPRKLQGRAPGDLAFNPEPKRYRDVLYRWLPRLGLAQRIEGHKYNEVHPHIFRKFFFSNVVGQMGEVAAHSLMGHQFYLSTYYKRPLNDRQADYRKAIPRLLVMRATGEEDLRKKLFFDQLKMFGLKDEQLKSVEDMICRKPVFEIDDQIQARVKELVQTAWGERPSLRPRAAGVM